MNDQMDNVLVNQEGNLQNSQKNEVDDSSSEKYSGGSFGGNNKVNNKHDDTASFHGNQDIEMED
jgi:hypothetical protein|tara:strand:+ start:3425 stop:3616 length:192 start_codon:yes stop_codon:yes gene_type:complete